MTWLILLSALLVFAIPIRGQNQPLATVELEGKIVNAIDRQPIGGARVEVSQQFGEPVYAKTDDDGRFRFTGLSPAYYVFNAERPGFLRTHEPRDVHDPIPMLDLLHPEARGASTPAMAGDWPITKSVGPDRTLHADVTVPLTPYAVITGKITEANGLPRANCPVEIRTRRTRSSAAADAMATVVTVHADDRGEYRAAPLAPGTYYVVANKSGPWTETRRVLRTTYYPGVIEATSATALKLAPGQQVRADIRMVAHAGVTVSGRVAGPAAGQNASTRVLLMQPDLSGGAGGFAETNGGRFELKNVFPGRYTLMALTRAGGTTEGKPVLAAIQQVEVGDQDTNGLDVNLEPLHDVTGTVTFAAGCTLVPVRVFAEGRNSLGVSRAETVATLDGQFVLSGLTPARHRLTVEVVAGSDVPGFQALARLGDRDVLKDGFDYPIANGGTLHIMVICTRTKVGQ